MTNSKKYDVLEIVAVCDQLRERAGAQAEKYGIGKVYDDVADIMADGEIEVILNLTNPNAHYPVNMMALKAGKHVCRYDAGGAGDHCAGTGKGAAGWRRAGYFSGRKAADLPQADR